MSIDNLGWIGVDKNAQEIVEQRRYLQKNNGIKSLEILKPQQIDDAVRIFNRDGFVVIQDALNAQQLATMNDACSRVINEMMELDGHRQGNRGSHRYSFGGASITGQLLHHAQWATLIDLPTVTPILSAIFNSDDYVCSGAGGDFCLPGAVDYQPLHSDMGDRREFNGRRFGSFHDPRGVLNYRDLPCPFVVCNFLMVDFTALNGPIRQIPGTQHSQQPIPRRSQEPQWMKLSTLCPAPAGSVVIRDVRAWHGGTPNLSDQVRAMPNAEFHAPWYREPLDISMPREIFDGLSAHAQKISRYIVAQSGQELATGYRQNLGPSPFAPKAPRV